jgi:glycosyltransferase involved in cell wall biosynthesis
VNKHTPIASLHGLEGRQTHAMRVVTLCGSIKPLFSGTDDFHDTLAATLGRKQIDVRTVDLKQWGLRQVPALLQHVATERPDVILMQYPTDAFGSSLGPHGFAALQRQAPLVVTLHEFAAANPVRRASLSVLLARASAIVLTAESERRALLAWFPWLRSRARVIPIGANFPGREWQNSEPPIVVYFGQIRPEKGLEDYVACCAAIAAQCPNARFVIAGSRVPKFATFYQQIKTETERQGIELLGELPMSEVPDFLRTAAAALLPFPSGASFRRGSLLAAAVCGVPIVTLHGAETPAEMTELLHPAHSREELVAQAVSYLSDPAKRSAAHDRSNRLAAMVSWDAIADRYVALFSNLTAQRALS